MANTAIQNAVLPPTPLLPFAAPLPTPPPSFPAPPLRPHSLTSSEDYAIANNLTPFISMQNHYNLIYREEEREMFPTLKVASPSRPLGRNQLI